MKFHQILKLTQDQLFDYVANRFPWAVIREKEYIFCPGNVPIMLVAHMDTVHHEPVKTICTSNGGNILMSPQGIGGDDRCGVYSLLKLSKSENRPSLLFTCDEEVGGLGAQGFSEDFAGEEDLKLKLIVELDRRGLNDAVYYETICHELEDYISTLGYITQNGTFSDISFIAPTLKVPAVNLSCGYYSAHTQGEYINLADMYWSMRNVQSIIQDIDSLPWFKYEDIWGEDLTDREWEYIKHDYLSDFLDWK